MTGRHGGEEHLAPVIPLFGSSGRMRPSGADESEVGPPSTEHSEKDRPAGERVVSFRTTGSSPPPASAEDAPSRMTRDAARFGAAAAGAAGRGDSVFGPVEMRRRREAEAAERAAAQDIQPDPDDIDGVAERALVRRLRSKQLSVREARSVLVEQGMRPERIEELLDDFCRRLYLDDRSLAGHLARSASERKGQGRMMLARTLSQRGIPREIVDEVLAGLDQDEDELALTFARSRAGALRGLDGETALRRLLGQLARRGFGGGTGMTAARTALTEEGVLGGRPRGFRPGEGGGVRFEESD